ncbi:MAG: hypothetical protein HQK78_08385 [Desulfobacterales bacterium]|nr:hypothetical protein [Desulfobacterales bacterium]
MKIKPYRIEYEFSFQNGKRESFQIALHPRTLNIIRSKLIDKPEWTRLDNRQCKCCLLKANIYLYCPISVNIAELVEAFKIMYSTESCLVKCITPERTYFKESTLQEGLFSIFGIVMATSDCPAMNFLKPMARYHLPFSTVNETMVRVVSNHLLREYFRNKNGKMPDFDLKQLNKQYENVRSVNEGILSRISGFVKKDADQNAIIILDSLAQILAIEIQDNLNSLEPLFCI